MIQYNKFALIIIIISIFGAALNGQSDKQAKALHDKIIRQRASIEELENFFNILLPEIQNSLKAIVTSKHQSDSVVTMIINHIDTKQNKICILEDIVLISDSTNLEILAQLVMIENKIVTLANHFTELYSDHTTHAPNTPSISVHLTNYKRIYIQCLSDDQNGIFHQARKGFSTLALSDPEHSLTDNSQYWLAECYCSQKNYKHAVIEFEKVFTFSGANKDDDAQLKLGLVYPRVGNLEKACEEYAKLMDYFPGNEFYARAKNTYMQLTSNYIVQSV